MMFKLQLSQWLKKTGLSIITGMRRFPATVGAALAIMTLALVLLHNDTTLTEHAKEWLTRVMLTLGLGIPISVALQLLLDRHQGHILPLRLGLWAVLAALLALYMVFLTHSLDKAETGMRYMALMLASVAVVPAVPHILRRRGDERFALKLLLRLLITGIFTGILIGGIDLVLLMLEKLLAVTLWDNAYMDVMIAASGVFAPSFFLAGVPRGGSDFEGEPYNPLIRVLLGYIGYPLLAAYTVIIYAYFMRILVLWSWPSNMLVNMVLWYTAIGVIAIYFLRSQNAGNRWFRLFDMWYPRLTLLPLALMYTGLFIRIGTYGMTEPRYFVLALALWVTASTGLMVFFPPDKRLNVVMPALLAVIALLSVLGPWSAFAVSGTSQNARLEALFARNSMLSAQGAAVPAKQAVTDKDKQEIYSILDYFDRGQGLDQVSALPKGATTRSLPQVLGFDRTGLPDSQNTSIFITGAPVYTLDISGYDTLFIGGIGTSQKIPLLALELSEDDQSVFTIIKDGKTIYTKDLKEYAKQLEGSYSPNRVYTLEELTLTDENELAIVKFIINNAIIDRIYGEPTYSVPSLYTLVKLK